jgi:hypothetical protein
LYANDDEDVEREALSLGYSDYQTYGVYIEAGRIG